MKAACVSEDQVQIGPPASGSVRPGRVGPTEVTNCCYVNGKQCRRIGLLLLAGRQPLLQSHTKPTTKKVPLLRPSY